MSILDTNELGPIRVEPDLMAARAKIVRDALMTISHELAAEGRQYGSVAFWGASEASDEVLARLGRLLK